MMKSKICLTMLLLCSMITFAQTAKKPTIMVIPSDHWCSTRYFTTVIENQGKKVTVNDYEAAFREDAELFLVASKIGEIMSNRDYPVKDFMQEYKSLMDEAVEEEVTQSSMGAMLTETPLDMLRRRVKYDIELRVDWTTAKSNGSTSLSLSIAAIDTYSNKQVAAANAVEIMDSLPIALQIDKMLTKQMDQFSRQLTSHFSDAQAYGREITLQLRIWDNSDITLEDEYDDEELIDVISDWMVRNTVDGSFNLSSNTEMRAKYEQVRIPMFNDKGRAMDARMFATNLRKFLKQQYLIESKVMNKGLGEAVVVIGEK